MMSSNKPYKNSYKRIILMKNLERGTNYWI